jgi:hypothetical protein
MAASMAIFCLISANSSPVALIGGAGGGGVAAAVG